MSEAAGFTFFEDDPFEDRLKPVQVAEFWAGLTVGVPVLLYVCELCEVEYERFAPRGERHREDGGDEEGLACFTCAGG